MSAAKSVLLLAVGATFATGALYVIQHQKQFPFLTQAMGEQKVSLTSDQLSKAQSLAQDLAKTMAGQKSKAQSQNAKQLADVMKDVDDPVVPQQQPQPEQAKTPEAQQAAAEIAGALNAEAPGLAKRDVPGTGMEAMQAALALRKQMQGSTTGNGAQDKILESMDRDNKSDEAAAATATSAGEGDRQPSSTTVILMDGTSAGVDPSAEEKIQALAVPESVRQEILKNYRRTGVMPSIAESK